MNDNSERGSLLGDRRALKLREATLDDAETLFQWRNDACTRAASRSSARIGWDDHVEWLRSSLADPTRTILIAEIGGEPVGRVRIDRRNETELSWTVAPEHRRKGVGSEMVARATPDENTVAYIKRDNVASQKIAKAAGFGCSADSRIQRWIKTG